MSMYIFNLVVYKNISSKMRLFSFIIAFQNMFLCSRVVPIQLNIECKIISSKSSIFFKMFILEFYK